MSRMNLLAAEIEKCLAGGDWRGALERSERLAERLSALAPVDAKLHLQTVERLIKIARVCRADIQVSSNRLRAAGAFRAPTGEAGRQYFVEMP